MFGDTVGSVYTACGNISNSLQPPPPPIYKTSSLEYLDPIRRIRLLVICIWTIYLLQSQRPLLPTSTKKVLVKSTAIYATTPKRSCLEISSNVPVKGGGPRLVIWTPTTSMAKLTSPLRTWTKFSGRRGYVDGKMSIRFARTTSILIPRSITVCESWRTAFLTIVLFELLLLSLDWRFRRWRLRSRSRPSNMNEKSKQDFGVFRCI